MARKVVELVVASGILRQTSVNVLDMTDASVTASPSQIVQGTTSGFIHLSWIPPEATRMLVRDTNSVVVVSGVRELVVASGDLTPLSSHAVRIKTANDALSDGDKGDIVVVSGQWRLKNQAVTTDKLQLFPQSVLLGTTTSGTVTHVTVGQGLTLVSGVLSVLSQTSSPVTLPTTGLLDYWTASSGVQADSGMQITQWNPVFGTDTLTQSDPALRPLHLVYNQYHAVCFPIRRHTALFSSFLPPTGQQARSFAFVYLPFLHVLNWIGGLFSYGALAQNAGFGFVTHVNSALSYAVDFVNSRVFLPITSALPISCVVVYNNNVITIALNGQIVSRANVASFNLNTGTSIPFRVGMAFAGTNEGTTGLLFELAVWNVALTEEQAVNVSTQFMRRYSNLF